MPKRIKNSIKVMNFDNLSTPTQRAVEAFPDIMRACLAGGSGSGKTNVLLTILMHKKPLADIFLCSKTSNQAKYKFLADLINSYNQRAREKIRYNEITNVEDLPPPEKIPENSIVIFDDILTEKQDKIATYFMRGRHRKISTFYLTQSFTKIPKKSGIRENFNYFILFRQDKVNLRQIFDEYSPGGLDFKQFEQICRKCWGEPYGFVAIDCERSCIKKNFEYVFN